MGSPAHPLLKAPVLAIIGPTASGKTAAALMLANQIDAEIINVDSGQIYQQMNIGTAKPTTKEQAQTPHWLLDIRDPKDSYSAAAFCEDATQAVIDIRSRQRVPILVGGTMFYLNALEHGLGHTPDVPSTTRQQLRAELDAVGPRVLHERLSTLDPDTAARLHVNDSQRILRALEVVTTTGTQMPLRAPLPSSLRVKKLALVPRHRARLHQAIEQRFLAMLDVGFIDEVQALMNRGDLSVDCPSMRSIGYRQVWEYLSGCGNEQDMINKSVAATRQLAKRQLTWLRGMRGIVWFPSDSHQLWHALSDYVQASDVS